jgi:hypothetical protein
MFISDIVTLSITKSLKKREAMHRFPRYARAALPRLNPLRNRAGPKCNLNLLSRHPPSDENRWFPGAKTSRVGAAGVLKAGVQ